MAVRPDTLNPRNFPHFRNLRHGARCHLGAHKVFSYYFLLIRPAYVSTIWKDTPRWIKSDWFKLLHMGWLDIFIYSQRGQSGRNNKEKGRPRSWKGRAWCGPWIPWPGAAGCGGTWRGRSRRSRAGGSPKTTENIRLYNQCRGSGTGSGSAGSACLWASWNRIH